MKSSRRNFLRSTALAGGAAWLAQRAGVLRADPIGLTPGMQLWTVREELQKDFAGTLRQVAAIGYREVELFETPAKPREFRKQVEDAGLKCVSGHFELFALKDPKTIDAASELGLNYMVLVFPTLRSLQGRSVDANFNEFIPLYEKISADDYKYNAEQLNGVGENLKKRGMRAGYHNHAIDFKKFGTTYGFDTMIQHTDPKLVCFEMDCGHVLHAGRDPVHYLNTYPTRIEMLHVKDLVKGFHVSTSLDTENMDTDSEIGAGCLDWTKIFAAAKRGGHLKHYFVEHEGKMAHPPLESLKISYNYLQTLKV